jgi:EmrB/QacA subfamily drug resistance transporter
MMQSRSGRRTALLVAAALFMENLDGTVIATAAPAIGRSFEVPAIDVNVVATAYLLTVAVLIPVSGWLADRFGARRVFCLAVVIFTAASVLCAVSTTLTELTVMRVLQGAGGALMVPVGRLVVLRVTPKSDLISAIAYLTWPGLVALVLGPAVGGVLAEYTSWRWIFLLNVPLGILALALTPRLIPKIAEPVPPGLDWLGFALTGTAVGCLMAGLEAVGQPSPEPLPVTLLLAAGVLVSVAAVVHLRRAAAPLLELGALRIRTFRVAQTGGSAFRVAISAVPFLVPLMLQEGFGWSPVQAGLTTLAIFVGNLLIKPATTPLLHGLGFRGLLIANGSATVLVLAALGLLGPSSPVWVVVVVLALSGVFRSVSFTAYNTITFADVPASGTAAANTLAATLFQLTVGVGAAAAALAVRAGDPLAASLGLTGPLGAYHVAFVLLAVLAATAVAEAVLLPRDAGSALTT